MHEGGEKQRKGEAAERERRQWKEEEGKESLFFKLFPSLSSAPSFSHSTSVFSFPPNHHHLRPQTTTTSAHKPPQQASPVETVKDAVEAVKDAVEDVKDAVVHAVEEATAEEEEPEAAAAPVEVKVQTSPHDARFPATNQSRHCYTRYNEYYRCVAQKGEEDEECKFVSGGGFGFWGFFFFFF